MSLSKFQQDIPDLCVLAIISQMSLLDRASAHLISPQWYHRVREVNRSTVRSLTIASGSRNMQYHMYYINCKLENILRSARLLIRSDGSPQFPFRRLTKWNCLQFSDDKLSSTSAKQIPSTFPFTTELIFIYSKTLESLTLMLQNNHWRSQLIHLELINSNCFEVFNSINDPTVPKSLFNAISSMTTLKYFKLTGVKLNELPIFSQLKEITITSYSYWESFRDSLKHYEAKNTVEFSVKILDNDRFSLTPTLFELSDNLRGSITSLGFHALDCGKNNLLSICASFPNLTLLSLSFSSSEMNRLFSALAQLHRLEQLKMSISFTDLDPQLEFTLPRSQLLSVVALDLHLRFNSHSQVPWLNLSETMPNLQAIHLEYVYCKRCNTSVHHQNCFQTVLQALHRSTGLPLNRLSCYFKYKYYSSAEKLFS